MAQQLAGPDPLADIRRRRALGTTRQQNPAMTRRLPPMRKVTEAECAVLTQDVDKLIQPVGSGVLTVKERDTIMFQQNARELKLPLLIIIRSAISVFSWQEMQDIAPVKVTNPLLTGSGSVNDPRMGVVSLNVACQYCSQIDCPGHYGVIDFGGQIYNPLFIREIISVLTCVCNDCGGLLINEDTVRRVVPGNLSYDKRLAKIEEHCKTVNRCIRTHKTLTGGKVVPCKKNPIYISSDIKKKSEITYKLPKEEGKVAKEQKDEESVPDKPLIKPIKEVYDILDSISTEDAALLGFPEDSHPRNMIMHGILVPPIIARPMVIEGGSPQHDMITHMYATIMRKAKTFSERGSDASRAILYQTVRQLIFKTEGRKLGPHDFLSIIERIQGKKAILREMMMGKRVDYCGRTVIGTEASLRFGELRCPQAWAGTLTRKTPVTDINIEYLNDLQAKGQVSHVILANTNFRKPCGADCSYKLKIGDTAERFFQNGDRTVANRQPTLHRQSMMGFKGVLGPQLTMGLHLSYTSPLNADFDGDEGNMWFPQDYETEAEVEILMNVVHNIMSSEQNRPIMGLVMNSITGAYLLTAPTTRVNDQLFAELMNMISDKGPLETLHYRLTKYGVHPRSGKAVFSALLPPDFTYVTDKVTIYEGILVKGQLTKSNVGASHRSIIQELHKKYRGVRTAQFFTDAAWIINKWIIERGFSVGLLDMTNFVINPKTGKEEDRNEKVLKSELAKLYVELEALGGKMSDPSEEAFRQKKINSISSVAQAIGIRLAGEVLAKNNSIGVMTETGAGTKGDNANIGQIMGAVGQQYYRGLRLKPTLGGGKRLLPVYDDDDTNPEANAFIPVSLYTGLNAPNLFFLQAGGREGLLDTALKTAETGSMQHRMIKGFENIVIGNDGSIRNALGTMFSPIYNSGYDVGELMMVEPKGRTKVASFCDIKSILIDLNVEAGWVPEKMNKNIVSERKAIDTERQKEIKEKVKKEVDTMVKNKIISSRERKKTTTMMEKQANVEKILSTRAPITKKAVVIPYDITETIPVVTLATKITKFEKARLIGIRATQISNNAPPLVEIGDEIDPVSIALMEYEQGALHRMYIRRPYPDGTFDKVRPTLENI